MCAPANPVKCFTVEASLLSLPIYKQQRAEQMQLLHVLRADSWAVFWLSGLRELNGWKWNRRVCLVKI